MAAAQEADTKTTRDSQASPSARKPLYYGWIIVATAFFIAMVSIGSRNGFGVFVDPMKDDFGWSVGLISIAASIGMLANGIFQPFMGAIYDRLGGRKVITVGLLIMGASTLLLAATPHILFLILIYGVVASVGMSAGSINTTAALLTRWFRRRRSTALGIATAGASMGGLVVVPFAMYLLQASGSWRLTWIALGALILLAVPFAYLLMRNDPREMGLQPDGDEDPASSNGRTPTPANRGPLEVEYWTESFRSPPFWQLSGAYFVCGATTAVMAVHFIQNGLDKGISEETASLAFGLMSALNIVGVIVASTLADRFPRKNLLAAVYGIRGLGYAVLLLAPAPWSIWGFASIVGFSWIATAPLTTSLAADMYGLKYIGTLSGVLFLSHQIGAAVSIQFAGIMRDVTGSYDLPFAIAGSLLVLATLSAFSVKEKKYSVKYQKAPSPEPTIA